MRRLEVLVAVGMFMNVACAATSDDARSDVGQPWKVASIHRRIEVLG